MNIDVGKPDAHLLVSFGEDFPSIAGNHGHRGTGPAAIQLVRKMDPSGHVILASNTTLKTTVRIIIRIFLDSFLIARRGIELCDTEPLFHFFRCILRYHRILKILVHLGLAF